MKSFLQCSRTLFKLWRYNMKLPRETSLIRTTTTSSSSGMIFFQKTQVAFLRGRITGTLLVLTVIILFKFLLDSQPSFVPTSMDLVTGIQQAEFQKSVHPQPEELVVLNHTVCEACNNGNTTRATIPNSYLPCKHYVRPGTSTIALQNISRYFKTSVVDSELLHAAQDASTRSLPRGPPKVAFLFIIRQKIPLACMWERFFAGVDAEKFSIYTHASWWVDSFPESSVFHNKSVATKAVQRFDVSLVDVVRRLLAFALLDVERANLWFVFVSEACVPVRSFGFVYQYFMNSSTSFVEAFSPATRFKRWQTEPVFRIEQLRKGELWMSMHRRHAGMVVGDVTFYRKFKADCRDACTLDEQYAQTLLHTLDPMGIANRSITYVDWSNPKHGGSPQKYIAKLTNTTLFEKIQRRTKNLDGQYMDSSDDVKHNMQTCVYNGQSHSPCFLFARKFSGDLVDVKALLEIPKSILGY